MTIQDLLDKCKNAYDAKDFKRLMELSDEVLKKNPDNQTAISYKSISYCFSNQPEKALEILDGAGMLYPDNHYHKNISAMAYYDLGEYEKSLKCCEDGLNIKDFDWLYENKIKALIKLDRIDEAIECYENGPWGLEIIDLFIECGNCLEAFKYCLDKDLEDFEPIIDKIKERDAEITGDYYISWIYNIKSKSDIRFCPDCGGELIPIVWGYPNSELLEKSLREEVFLGGCCMPINPANYHCRKCGGEFDMGCEGLHIECDDYNLSCYIEYKIEELTSKLRKGQKVFIRSLNGLKKELQGFDDEEFDAFIRHLNDLDYIYQPREGFIKLSGYDDLKCAKEYLDEGKFAAPRWLVYPQLSAWTIGWRMGDGENYAMNEPPHDEEFRKLFSKPKYWNFKFGESPYKPHPLNGYFGNGDGKPKYPNSSEGIEVNDFITLDDVKEFISDTFCFTSIRHAVLLSKFMHFEKCSRKANLNALMSLELTSDEEKIWDVFKYSVLLNSSYFKVMQDEELKRKLLETGNEALIYVSDDEENLFGRALMELRDEIRRLYENEDRIDWEFTEYLKYNPWWK